MSEGRAATEVPVQVHDQSWHGCRCLEVNDHYCSGWPNRDGPSGGALCCDCDGSGDALPHLAHALGWRPSWATS